MVPLIQITADEVNHIIYSYLQDSGFLHSAFALRVEGRLEQSSHFNEYVPRGELVELLTKALLYIEVETHCKGDGLITDCKTPFALLKRHACSVDAMDEDEMMNGSEDKSKKQLANNGIMETPLKRKADLPAEGDGPGRRVKRSAEPDVAESSLDVARSPHRIVTPTPDRDHSPMTDVRSSTQMNGELTKKKKVPGKNCIMLHGPEAEVFVCAWKAANPSVLAAGSKDATVRIWHLPDPPDDISLDLEEPEDPPIVLKHLPYLPDARDITSLDWNVDGTLLASGSYDSTVRIWTATGNLYMSNPQHQGPIFAARFSKSGRWLLTASLDGTACVWDVPARKLLMQHRVHADCCLDVEWLDEETFATAGADKLVHILSLGSQTPLRTFEGHTNEVNQIKFDPSKKRIASCSDDRTARIWEIGDLSRRLTQSDAIPGLGMTSHKNENVLILQGHKDSIGNCAWCPHPPNGSHDLLVTASFDGSVRLWDAVTGACIKSLEDHTRSCYALTFSPDGKFFATGSGDGKLLVYEATTGKNLWKWFSGPEKPAIYEIEWQLTGKLNRIALCLEKRMVGVIDITRVPELTALL